MVLGARRAIHWTDNCARSLIRADIKGPVSKSSALEGAMSQSLVLPSLATVCLLALLAGAIQADTDCTEYGVLLRDDFEDSPARKAPDDRQWSETHGVVLSKSCTSKGPLAGNSAVFNGRERRMMVTRDLAADVITAVRFDAIECFLFSGSVVAQLSYSTNRGIDYHQAKNFTVSSFGSSVVYELPSFSNDAYVRIRLREVSLFTGIADYHTWEVDNFFVYGKHPSSFATDFDTVAACNERLTWIGASVQPSDDGNALNFTSRISLSSSAEERVASTVPINLDSSVPLGSGKRQIIFSHDFSSSTTFGRSSSWKAISGGVITASRCAAYGTDDQAFFRGSISSRFIETNPLDLEQADKLDFWIVIGDSGCSRAYFGQDVSVEYSLERNPWNYVRMRLMEQNLYTEPQLVSVRLPFLARTSRTRIRWRQTSHSGYGSSEWSLNHVVISGNVHLTELSSFPAQFSSSTTFGSSSYWAAISGGQVSRRPDCFAYGSGYQAFFNRPGQRFIKTQSLDLRNVEMVTFWIVIGGGRCDFAESINKSVVVEYAYQDSSNFRIMKFLKNDGYQRGQYADALLPLEARTASTTIRWRQLQNSGYWKDEWSINNIRFTGSVVPVLERFPADFTSSTTFGSQSLWARISGGSVTEAAKCRAYGTFQAFFSQSEERFIQTQPLDLRSAAYLHFRIAFGGGCEPADSGDSVVVEYSSSQNSTFIVIHTVESNVALVTVLLPLSARTASTAIRWRQMKHGGESLDEWSLNHVIFNRTGNFPSNFSSSTSFGESGLFWSVISGGNVSNPCPAYGLPYQAFFYQSGPRYIRTQALDLRGVRAIFFRLVSGESGCGATTGFTTTQSTTTQSIVVEYSTSQYFHPLQYLSYNSTYQSSQIEVALPIAAQVALTTVQWRQISNRGNGFTHWALSDIEFILEVDFPRNFSAQDQSWASISGGSITNFPSCYAFGGLGSYQAFFSGPKDRYIATHPLDLRNAEKVAFWIVLGGSGCDGAEWGESVVVEYASLPSNFKIMFTVPNGRWEPERHRVPLPLDARTPSTVIRWRQLAFSYEGDAEWAINGVYFVAQVVGRFSESFPPDFSASTTFGEFSLWAELSGGTITEHADCHSYGTYQAFFSGYEERYIRTQPLDLRKMKELMFWFVLGCDPAELGESVVVEFSTSTKNRSFATISHLGYNDYTVSKLVKVPLPAEARTASTTIQWRQLHHIWSYGQWSLNHVAFIPEVLLGKNFPSDFSDATTFGQFSEWGSISGGSITNTAKCNAYGVYQAFFTQSGPRSIQTQPLDLAETELLTFWIIIGGGGCDPAETGDSVVVEYTHSDRAYFTLLLELSDNAYRSSQPVTIKLPFDARKRATVIRWRQHQHSGAGSDEWALNHVSFTSGSREKVLEFDLIMKNAAQDLSSYDINLEYSVDLGQNWQIMTACNPTTLLRCNAMMPYSTYQSVLFQSWKRMQIKLDDAVISSRTQFRYRQPNFSSTTNWAIDNVYIGNYCPGNCSGHGKCITTAVGKGQNVVCGGNDDGRACTFPFFFNSIQYYSCIVRGRGHPWCATTSNYDTDKRWGYCECGTCQCDSGYSGVLCNVSSHTNPTYLRETFETGFSSSKWSWVGGGLIGTLCGVISAGNAAVFYTGRSRFLQTVDLDLTAFLPELEFTFYSTKRRCLVPLSRSTNYVALQFSTDGGITWSTLDILSQSKQRAIYSLTRAQTNSTRLRWFQAFARGSDLDAWAVDDIYINSVHRLPFFDSFNPMNDSFWTFYPGSTIQPFCSSSFFSSLYFSSSFSTTRLVDCGGRNISSSTSVELQYSRSNDVWTLLDSGCQQIRGCSRGGFRSSSIYRSGSTSNWTRFTIPFRQTKLPYLYSYSNRYTQLRWLASSSAVSFGWAIDNVYIGNSCPNFCSSHGRCTTEGQCLCDSGYRGYQCRLQSATYKPSQIKERFDGKYFKSEVFSAINSANVSNECGYLSSGNSLVFIEEGERELVTVDMDATRLTNIQFIYRYCGDRYSILHQMVVQYSLNGGVTWAFLAKTGGSSKPMIRSASLPKRAKTSQTRFRFWQYGYYSAGQSAWAIDDLFIGEYALKNVTELTETLVSNKSANWIQYFGAEISSGKCNRWSPVMRFNQSTMTQSNAITTEVAFLSMWNMEVYELFDKSFPWGWSIEGGQSSTRCGIVDSGHALVFDGCCTRRLTTRRTDTSAMDILEFHLMIGGSSEYNWHCDNADHRSESVVLSYSTDGYTWKSWQLLSYDAFRRPRHVSLTLPLDARNVSTRFQWAQDVHDGAGTDVWSIDSIVIRRNLTETWYVAQFDINVGCGLRSASENEGVSFDFLPLPSTNWRRVEKGCLPELCRTGEIYLMPSIYYSTGSLRRITLALSPDVVTMSTRFRWHQPVSSLPWAIDNIFIGHSCPKMCTGRGRCQPDHCICDQGFTGRYCETVLANFATEMIDTFSSGELLDQVKWSFAQGAVFSDEALKFSLPGYRQIVTADLDTTRAGHIEFDLQILPLVAETANDVLLHFSLNGGLTWILLKTLPHASHTSTSHVVIGLPSAAKSRASRFRWWQPDGPGRNTSDWTLTDVFIGESNMSARALEDDFDPIRTSNWLFISDLFEGHQFCWNQSSNRSSSDNAFLSSPGIGQKYITSRDLKIFDDYYVTFEFNIGCEISAESLSDIVYFQYSIDFGTTWVYLKTLCNTETFCDTPSSIGSWSRIVASLPRDSLSNRTRFRWYHSAQSGDFIWAIDNVYIGPACSDLDLCSGRGQCVTVAENSNAFKCNCDYGFSGDRCQCSASNDKDCKIVGDKSNVWVGPFVGIFSAFVIVILVVVILRKKRRKQMENENEESVGQAGAPTRHAYSESPSSVAPKKNEPVYETVDLKDLTRNTSSVSKTTSTSRTYANVHAL